MSSFALALARPALPSGAPPPLPTAVAAASCLAPFVASSRPTAQQDGEGALADASPTGSPLPASLTLSPARPGVASAGDSCSAPADDERSASPGGGDGGGAAFLQAGRLRVAALGLGGADGFGGFDGSGSSSSGGFGCPGSSSSLRLNTAFGGRALEGEGIAIDDGTAAVRQLRQHAPNGFRLAAGTKRAAHTRV